MLIVDSQIHIWQNGKMSAQHRQIPTYSIDDAVAEMASAGVDCAVIHPPSALGEPVILPPPTKTPPPPPDPKEPLWTRIKAWKPWAKTTDD